MAIFTEGMIFADDIQGLAGKRFLECFFQIFQGLVGSQDSRIGYSNYLPPKQIEVNGALALVRTWNPQATRGTSQAKVSKGRVYIEIQGITTQEDYDDYETMGSQFWDRVTQQLISRADMEGLIASEDGLSQQAVSLLPA